MGDEYTAESSVVPVRFEAWVAEAVTLTETRRGAQQPMELDSAMFPTSIWLGALIVYASLLLLAIRHAPWRRLGDSDQLHVFLGSCAFLIMLWLLRTEMQAGLVFHLLAVTSLTLMFGWSLAVVGVALVLLAISLGGLVDLRSFGLNGLIEGVLPISLTWIALLLTRHYLPRHFFIYVFINAFLVGGLAAVLTAFLVSAFLLLSGAYTARQLGDYYLPFFPLMFLPEAMLNGWIMTLLVGFKPHWVGSFSDADYLDGK